MAIRWQRFGVRSHALDGGHQPVAGELIRALCEACLTVGDRDVQPYDPTPWGLPCEKCADVWNDMGGEQ